MEQEQKILSYDPSPDELLLFEALFRSADTTNNGNMITCEEALDVLSLSRLSERELKMIVAMANNGRSRFLNKEQFYVTGRLIQLRQNQESIRNFTLTAPDHVHLNPPYFRGISELISADNNSSHLKIFNVEVNSNIGSPSIPSIKYTEMKIEIDKLKKELNTTISELNRVIQDNNKLRQDSFSSNHSLTTDSPKEVDNAKMSLQKEPKPHSMLPEHDIPRIFLSNDILGQAKDEGLVETVVNFGDEESFISMLTENTLNSRNVSDKNYARESRSYKISQRQDLLYENIDDFQRRNSQITLSHSTCKVSKMNDILDCTDDHITRAKSERMMLKRHLENANL